ncbi:MAG: FadR family transcriptional regulator [Mangrovicoccus sp.]|nr:FadR family transcriptional regulator [Mangrovicoccus sp.]
MADTLSLFDPIDHVSVADAVVHQIESMLVAGVLKQGERLPSERDLAEALDVSRPKIREALKTLETRQLVEVRHGEGSFIARLTGSAMSPALMELYARHSHAFFDYLEYRRAQEAFAAELAAQRATASDHRRISASISRLQKAWENGDDLAAREADVTFHSAIVDASHNATLIHMMGSIYELTQKGLFYNRRYLRAIDGSGLALLEQHKAIGAAILDGHPDAARQAALDHLDFVAASMRKGVEDTQRETMARKRLGSPESG